MIEKLITPKTTRNFSLKNWVAYVLFGAIILVFAFFGINPDRFGRSEGGGVD